uniref:Uncharacterized protein n=1 Tax=Zonotrichia albicollis TaxID=44394 RepID=A0A8D2NJ28_ZONAL
SSHKFVIVFLLNSPIFFLFMEAMLTARGKDRGQEKSACLLAARGTQGASLYFLCSSAQHLTSKDQISLQDIGKTLTPFGKQLQEERTREALWKSQITPCFQGQQLL